MHYTTESVHFVTEMRSAVLGGAMAIPKAGPKASNRIVLLGFLFLGVSLNSLLASVAGTTPVESTGISVSNGFHLFVTGNATVTAYYFGGTSEIADAVFLNPDSDPAPSSAFFCNPTGSQFFGTCPQLQPGDSVNLGTFTAGSELILEMKPLQQTWRNIPLANWVYVNGSGTSNPDGVIHAYITDYTADTGAPSIPAGVFVGFEDLFGGGDEDYNDLMFVLVANAVNGGGPVPITLELAPATVPEPATYALFFCGALVFGLLMRLKRGPFIRRPV
jgi:hypothetical protein